MTITTGLPPYTNEHTHRTTYIHTTFEGQISAGTEFIYTTLIAGELSSFLSPPALLCHLLAEFLLKQPVNYATNIQNDLPIHKL